MIIRETRSFQIHAGKDLYPLIGSYLGERVATRMDTAKHLAETNRILIQAEAEGKEYVEGLLHAFGRQDIVVTFDDKNAVKEVDEYLRVLNKNKFVPLPRPGYTAHLDAMPFGFLPLPR